MVFTTLHRSQLKKSMIMKLLHLVIGEADGFINEKIGSKYLVFGSTDENKKIELIKLNLKNTL